MEEQEFLLLADLLPEGLLMVTGNGDILAVNKVAKKQLKSSSCNLVGRNLAEFIGMERDHFLSQIRHCTRSRMPIRLALISELKKQGLSIQACEGFLLTPAQDEVEAQILLRLSDSNNQTSKFLTLNNQNIKLQRLLRNLNEKKRQLKETINQLTKTKEFAEEANKEKSRFLSNMSHELRTPMHAILGFTDISLRLVKDDEVKKYLNYILTSGKRLTELLDNLLDLHQLEAGKMLVDFAKHDITIVTQQCAAELHSLSNEKGLTIKINADQMIEGVFDQKLMSQVITNLLSNAIKFSPADNTINVNIDRKMERLNGRQQMVLIFSVIDQGIGIPTDEHDKVFDRFIQSSKTTTSDGGTGLGLSIVKDILDIHRGKIWVVSPIEKLVLQSDKNKHVGTAINLMIPAEQISANE
ncbi:MAG: ATP-binding protein [Candidatus Scalindua sp.]